MSYLAYSALALVALLLVLIVRGNAAHRRLQRASEGALARIYMPSSALPQLALSHSYGYPSFQVTFTSKLELQAAADAGLNESFKREIDALCKGRCPKDRPFTAEQGVFFTYDGWLPEQLKRDKQALREQRRDA